MNQPKISIIVPVYNVSKYIIRCIDSVINQTYNNIECILVDDCSPDDSIVLVKQRLQHYEGNIEFKIVHHEQNKGLSGARNTGTRASIGAYLYYLDSDDELTTDCIETLYSLVEKYPEVEIVQGNLQNIPQPPKSKDFQNIRYKNFPEYVNDNNWICMHFYDRMKKDIPMNACSKLIKRSFIVENDLFFYEGIIHEDEIWMFYVVKKLKAIAFSTKFTYLRHIVPNSIMQSTDKSKSIRSMYIISKKVFADVNDPYFEYIKKKYIVKLYHAMRLISRNAEQLKLYTTLVKDLLKNKKTKSIVLYILLLPPFFYKSLIAKIIFKFYK
ncbi:MAG: glycosyltransferase family 2 protein [Prevotellaceae bacterium]|jgi:glycosyltransferase involved in cell wall biosynthesis|nr:glycosyltransferase family 2 protein [Prevotellaceae bacterium]